MNFDYQEYLASNKWKQKARQVRNRDKHRCVHCSASACELHVHHLTYKHLRNEPLDDLITLCKPCHQKLHNLPRDPQFINTHYVTMWDFLKRYPSVTVKSEKKKDAELLLMPLTHIDDEKLFRKFMKELWSSGLIAVGISKGYYHFYIGEGLPSNL